MFRRDREELTFDQSFIDITVLHGTDQFHQIKVAYKWKEEKFEGRLPSLTCQWFNKSPSSMDLIADVSDVSYQPSILDVNTTIYIQIMPVSAEMEYIGMPITKFVGPLELSPETEEQVRDLLEAGKSTYFVELKQVRLRDDERLKSSKVREALLKVVRTKLMLYVKFEQSEKSELLKQFEVQQEYPKMSIDRRNSKLMSLDFGGGECVSLLLQNHRIRDVLYLLIQRIRSTCEVQSTLENAASESQKQPLPQQSPEKAKQSKGDEESKGQQISEFAEQESEVTVYQARNAKQAQCNLDQPKSKSEQTLPKSPQTIQPNQGTKQHEDHTSKLLEMQAKYNFLKQQCTKQLQTIKQYQTKVKQLNDSSQRQLSTMRAMAAEKQQFEQQANYFRNECRVQKECIGSLEQQMQQLKSAMLQLQIGTRVNMQLKEAEKLFGQYLQFTRHQLLTCILQLKQEIDTEKRKTEYQRQHSQQLQSQIHDLLTKLEGSQSAIKKMDKKLQSLNKSSSASDYQPQQHTHTHQIASYEFQISKLKQQLNLLGESKQQCISQRDKTLDNLKVQVRELIEENSYYRAKDKSSKGELKVQIVELKKLVNRFAESITEKDLEISQLRLTNKEICKNLQALQK